MIRFLGILFLVFFLDFYYLVFYESFEYYCGESFVVCIMNVDLFMVRIGLLIGKICLLF